MRNWVGQYVRESIVMVCLRKKTEMRRERAAGTVFMPRERAERTPSWARSRHAPPLLPFSCSSSAGTGVDGRRSKSSPNLEGAISRKTSSMALGQCLVVAKRGGQGCFPCALVYCSWRELNIKALLPCMVKPHRSWREGLPV